MEDQQIIELFWNRNEAAITETDAKYGKLCLHIARNILSGPEDCEECVNDTYLTAWNLIPPQVPRQLSHFIGRITRNLALKKFEYLSAAKRNPDAVISLGELGDCVSGKESLDEEWESHQIQASLNRFLEGLNPEPRKIFLWRYWYFLSMGEIAQRAGYSESKVKSMLHRTRKSLRIHFAKEGIQV